LRPAKKRVGARNEWTKTKTKPKISIKILRVKCRASHLELARAGIYNT